MSYRVVVSYADCDRKYVDGLLLHLDRIPSIECWAESLLQGGDVIPAQRSSAITSAHFAIVLISAEYLRDKGKEELPLLLDRANRNQLRLLPVLCRAVLYDEVLELRNRQWLLPPATSLSAMSEHALQTAFVAIAAQLKELCGSLDVVASTGDGAAITLAQQTQDGAPFVIERRGSPRRDWMHIIKYVFAGLLSLCLAGFSGLYAYRQVSDARRDAASMRAALRAADRQVSDARRDAASMRAARRAVHPSERVVSLAEGLAAARADDRWTDADRGLLAAASADPLPWERYLLLSGHKDAVTSATFSPDGTLLATAGDDRTVRLWSSKDGKLQAILQSEQSVLSLTFSPDGNRVVAGESENRIELWDIETHQNHSLSKNHFKSWVNSVAFRPAHATGPIKCDGVIPHQADILCTTDSRGAVKVWYLEHNKLVLCHELPPRGGPGRSVRFSPDGRQLIAASNDGALTVWDVQTWAKTLTLDAKRTVNGVEFSPSLVWPQKQWFAYVGTDQTVRLYDLNGRRELAVGSGHRDSVASVAFFPDAGHLVSASDDGTARLWDLTHIEQEAGKLRSIELSGHRGAVSVAAVAPNGQLMATTGYHDSRVWLWRQTEPSHPILSGVHELGLLEVAFSPDGNRVLTGGKDQLAVMWEALDGTPQRHILMKHEDWVNRVAFSPDKVHALTASLDGTVQLWEVATHRQKKTLRHEADSYSVSFGNRGAWLIAGGFKTGMARIWEPQSCNSAQAKWVQSLGSIVLSPDSSTLIATGYPNKVHVFEVNVRLAGPPILEHCADERHTENRPTLKKLREIEVPGGSEINSLSFAPDGKRLALGTKSGEIHICDLQNCAPDRVPHTGSSGITSLVFAQDGRLGATDADGHVRLWATNLHDLSLYLQDLPAIATGVDFSPDGRRIVVGFADGTARIYPSTKQGFIKTACLALQGTREDTLLNLLSGEQGESSPKNWVRNITAFCAQMH